MRPLGKAAQAVLTALPRTPGSPFALPAARGAGSFTSLPDALERIVGRASQGDVSAHTLWHSLASTGGDLCYSDSTIGAMLGHAGHGVTSRHIHHLDAVLLAAADWVATQIAVAMTDMRRQQTV